MEGTVSNYSGDEAETLSIESILSTIESLKKNQKSSYPIMADVIHNVSPYKMNKFFERKEDGSVKMLYGIPVAKRTYVPLDEMWLIDNKGEIISKYKI